MMDFLVLHNSQKITIGTTLKSRDNLLHHIKQAYIVACTSYLK